MLLRLTGIFVFVCLLPCWAAAQTPAPMYYGSIVNEIGTPAAADSVLDFSPIYVAQNTSPASIGTPAVPLTATAPATPSPPMTAPPVLPSFDPYAAPASTSWLSPFTQTTANAATTSPLGQSSSSLNTFDKFAPNTVQAIRRFREATAVDFSFMPGGGKNNSFGLGQIDLQMRLAFPCRFIPNNGGNTSGTGWFFIVPGASLTWFDGPLGPPDMSANAFGTFLKFGTEPQFNNIFGLKAWGQLGIFSDYHKATSEAFRLSGNLEGTIRLSQQMQIAAGVLYLGRERVRLLPTGGLIYTPNDDLTLRLVFPNPKITKRLWKGQRADISGYISADYCGSTWDIKSIGATDYNDIHLGTGLEFITPQKIAGYLESGGAFARELYTDGHRWNKAPNVLYLKTGFVF
ncbi:MAG: hypothetical protein LBT46_01765 [Planctomycetaceae bacterium]|nr:hypothetical protein [Planctomycetaceae bacterium]